MSLRRVILAAVGAVLLAGYLARASVLEGLGRFLIEEQPVASADAIVVLSGGFPDRILEGVALYRGGFAPRIVLCRERESAAFRRLRELGVGVPRGTELNRSVAEQLGVPGDAIVSVDRLAGSTFSEAQRVLQYAREHGFGSILLVTSKYHSHRAGIIYRYLAGDSLRIISRPAYHDAFRADTWWKDRASTRRVFIEYQKLLVFFLLDRWRVAPVPARPIVPAEGRS